VYGSDATQVIGVISNQLKAKIAVLRVNYDSLLSVRDRASKLMR